MFYLYLWLFLFCYPTFIVTSPAAVSSGGTGNSSATAYALLAGGTTSVGALQSITTGTAGQILTSSGAGALPTWTKLNGMILIQAQTASNSAAITFTNFPTAFKVFLIIVEGFDPSAAAQTLQGQWSTDGGSSFLSSGYLSGINNFAFNSTTISNINRTTVLAFATGSSSQHSAFIYLFGMNGNFATSTGPCALGYAFSATNPTVYGMHIGTISGSPTANAFRLNYLSGTIVTGRAYLYGII